MIDALRRNGEIEFIRFNQVLSLRYGRWVAVRMILPLGDVECPRTQTKRSQNY